MVIIKVHIMQELEISPYEEPMVKRTIELFNGKRSMLLPEITIQLIEADNPIDEWGDRMQQGPFYSKCIMEVATIVDIKTDVRKTMACETKNAYYRFCILALAISYLFDEKDKEACLGIHLKE